MESSNLDTTEVNDMERNVRTFLPDIIADLKNLITVPSVAFPGYPSEPVYRMAGLTAALLKRYGLPGARLMEIPGGLSCRNWGNTSSSGSTNGTIVRPL